MDPFLTVSRSHVDDMLDVNLKGPVRCSQSGCSGGCRAPPGPSYMLPVSGFAAEENASIYRVGKAALSSLAQGMALELAAYGIRVNAVAPGDILTAASRSNVPGRYSRLTPLGRSSLGLERKLVGNE